MARRKRARRPARRAITADLPSLLSPPFMAKHVEAALGHYTKAVADFAQSDWEGCISKIGKFVEALLKAMGEHCHVTFEAGRKFKADKLMKDLGQLPQGSFDDTLRLLMPRACRFIYDVASNRGARHDPHEVDSNSMDANATMAVASWLLAESIRYAQRGAVDPSAAEAMVESLTERRYPVIEKVGGRMYLHAAKKSAVDVALVVLAQHHPKRMAPADVIDIVRRNGFSQNNAKLALSRITKLVDEDEKGEIRLLTTGLKRAEQIIRNASTA